MDQRRTTEDEVELAPAIIKKPFKHLKRAVKDKLL
jgi:hypothetical protein